MDYQRTHHAIFPTLVTELYYDKPNSIKESIRSSIKSFTNDDGLAGESSAKVSLHLDPAFDELFRFAEYSIKQFVAGYNIDPEIFDFHIVKSWANVLRNASTPLHDHRDAHISFCYYVNVPKDQNMSITFVDKDYKHEPFSQMLRCNKPYEYTLVNSTSWYFNVSEGMMVVFPASLSHMVRSESGEKIQGIKTTDDFDKHRISVAGDVILTHKKITTNPLGLQPVSNWRSFS